MHLRYRTFNGDYGKAEHATFLTYDHDNGTVTIYGGDNVDEMQLGRGIVFGIKDVVEFRFTDTEKSS